VPKSVVIGAGFSGLSTATHLAAKGHEVTVLEKNESPGGRARVFGASGFTFDMGPSWYWMPDVFERYFGIFGKKVSDYYDLVRLDPSYRVYFGKDDLIDVPANLDELMQLFESIEKGSAQNLKKFLNEAAYKYEVGINDLVHRPSLKLTEFMDSRILTSLFKMDLFKSMTTHLKSFFKNERLIKLLEFPVLFLGAKPTEIPALYSLMNYADLKLGTWYPMGGMSKIPEAMHSLALEMGVKFQFNSEVEQILIKDRKANKIVSRSGDYEFDHLVASADYHHVDKNLLPKEYSNYKESYWDKRVMAPSSLLFYLGVDKKIEGLKHHNLFFDRNFSKHAVEIYDDPKWPSEPLFYVCAPSKTDPSVAPEGKENLFLLMPVAPELKDDEEIREQYYDLMMDRLEHILGEEIRSHVSFKRSYAHSDFKKDYYAFKGNAYGLANTLKQTAILKPSLKNKKLNNLYYTGQLTVPGPGVPPSIISGEVVAGQILKS